MKNIISTIVTVSVLFQSCFYSQLSFGKGAKHIEGHVFVTTEHNTWARDDGKEFPMGTGEGRVGGSGSGWGESKAGGPAGSGSRTDTSSNNNSERSRDFYSKEQSGDAGNSSSGKNNRSEKKYNEVENEILKDQAEKFAADLTDSISNLNSDIGNLAQLNKNSSSHFLNHSAISPVGIRPSLEETFNSMMKVETGKSLDESLGENTLIEKIQTVKAKLITTDPQTNQGKEAKNIGIIAANEAQKNVAANNEFAARSNYAVALAMLDIALDFIPGIGFGKAVYEGLSGKSILSGDSLSTEARVLALVVAGTLGYGAAAANGIKLIESIGLFALRNEAKVIEKCTEKAIAIISGLKNVKIHDASLLNKALREAGQEASYVEGGLVISGETTKVVHGYRAHEVGKSARRWGSFENPNIIGKSIYAEKYALAIDNLVEVSKVEIPKGVNIEFSLAGQNKWGSGGGLQFKILQEVSEDWFTVLGKIK